MTLGSVIPHCPAQTLIHKRRVVIVPPPGVEKQPLFQTTAVYRLFHLGKEASFDPE